MVQPSARKLSMWLDDYEDIFSSFDPRPYRLRTLSDDFLIEAKKYFKEKPKGEIELILLVPPKLRKAKSEGVIRKRLREHFMNQAQDLRQKRNALIREGALFIGLGIVMMMVTTFVLVHDDYGFLLTFLSVIAEPAGWFLFWEGLNVCIFETKQFNFDQRFNERLAKASIKFMSDVTPVKK